MKRAFGRLTLLAVFIFVWFGAFEGGLRLAGGSEAGLDFRELFTQDPVIGYRLHPSKTIHFATSEFATDISINSGGVRDDEIPPKPLGERRIVVLGDSLVLAVQVPLQQTFCKLLERQLNARQHDLHYRVINAGVQGYGPVEEALFYERVASKLRPDLVLIVVFIGNDAVEAADGAFRLTAHGVPNAAGFQPTVHDRLRRLVRRSIVLQIVNQRWSQLRERVRGARPARPDRRLLSYATPLPADIARGFEVSREAIARIASDAAGGGARTAIVLMPARFQLDVEEYERLRATVEPAGYQMGVDTARDRFAHAFEPLGLPLLDLLPPLRASRSKDMYFVSTGHLTPAGHVVVADALRSFLDASHLVP